MSKRFVLIGVIFGVVFSTFVILVLGSMNDRIRELNQEISKLGGNLQIREKEMNDAFQESERLYSVLLEKTTLIEESVDFKNLRWAKIKKVRSAVQKTYDDYQYSGRMNTLDLTQYASAVVDGSEEYDVPIPLILAMTRKESAFKSSAKSHAGALGVMQIIPSTAQEIAADLGVRHYSLYKIRDNVKFGVYYIMKMMDEFKGDVNLAVRAYNCGPTCVRRVLSKEYSDYPQETKKYADAILGSDTQEGFVKYYENMGL